MDFRKDLEFFYDSVMMFVVQLEKACDDPEFAIAQLFRDVDRYVEIDGVKRDIRVAFRDVLYFSDKTEEDLDREIRDVVQPYLAKLFGGRYEVKEEVYRNFGYVLAEDGVDLVCMNIKHYDVKDCRRFEEEEWLNDREREAKKSLSRDEKKIKVAERGQKNLLHLFHKDAYKARGVRLFRIRLKEMIQLLFENKKEVKESLEKYVKKMKEGREYHEEELEHVEERRKFNKELKDKDEKVDEIIKEIVNKFGYDHV